MLWTTLTPILLTWRRGWPLHPLIPLNPICNYLALLRTHPILHNSSIRVNNARKWQMGISTEFEVFNCGAKIPTTFTVLGIFSTHIFWIILSICFPTVNSYCVSCKTSVTDQNVLWEQLLME